MSSKIKCHVTVYLDPDVHRQARAMKHPDMPDSTFYATVIEEALGIKREGC